MSENYTQPHIILGSGSPQRKKLMHALRVEFDIIAPRINERKFYDIDPVKRAVKLSEAKCEEIQKDHPDSIIITGDSFSVFNGEILEKAKTAEEAIREAKKFSGKTINMISAYTLYKPGSKEFDTDVVISKALMKNLTEKDIQTYMKRNEWRGKAAPYSRSYIEKLEGSYFAVIGLPIDELAWKLFQLGVTNVIR